VRSLGRTLLCTRMPALQGKYREFARNLRLRPQPGLEIRSDFGRFEGISLGLV